ncbi:putative pectinesterase/pectinesterase inhibitor 21 [Hibiscus syriacus]|uniref:Pectinesterase/pectinesterase inhibitor 21 n=1 Tax=Hibiscus syriacus TaxID=106335 RepID=A0A6A2Y6Z4_HIBSY|nr:putative pectinesterase/pectinesterase inhibitor 21 [Hibiscus syriacus]
MALTDNGQTTRIAIIAVCSLIFVGIVIAVVIGFTTNSPKGEPYRDNEDDDDDDGFQVSDSVKAVKSICRPTDFKQTCEEELLIEARNSAGVKELVEAAFKAGVKFATHAVENSTALRERTKDPRALLALENCKQLLTYSIFELHKSISKVDELDVGNIDRVLEDLKILLSATITNRQTCLDGFHNTTTTIFRGHMKDALNMSMRLSKIGLAITCELSDTLNQLQFQGVSRGLLGHADWSSLLDESPRERRLLQEKEPHVIGHMDSSSMMDKNPSKRSSVTKEERLIHGHGDFSSLLDENKRRLLQEKEPNIDGYYDFIDGHDDSTTMLDNHPLLQEIKPRNRPFVSVDGHDDYGTMLDKRRLLQEKELNMDGHYDFIDGHDDYATMLDKRPLVQEVQPRGRPYVSVDGHDDYSTILDKRRLLQEKEPQGNGHYDFVDGHDDYITVLDKRRLLQEKESSIDGHYDFIDGHDDYISVLDKRSLLQENDPRKRRIIENDPSKLKPHVVVAEDGSGDFKTIEDAITLIPHNAQEPFVIYIKKGIYEENIIFNYNMTNIALIGDGKEKTRITGRLNYDDGLNTFNTATVAVHGDFFYAKNIGIENTAGAAKHQAVALMVISDFAVVYNCSINGHQNTLYVHSKRQFYRDCTVSGTIDFIFGDAASVFQNCKFVVRKPLEGQKNVVTAQGRSDERQPTGIVIQNSTIIADDDLVHLKNRYPTFLGRPLGNFSRTIIMETFIDDFIKPEGWTVGDDHRGLETSHFSEYNNRGPGSSTTGRVSWPAIKKLSPTTAHGFTPGKFFLGDDWIKAKGVPYTSGFSERQTRKLNMEVPSVLAADN